MCKIKLILLQPPDAQVDADWPPAEQDSDG